jgi:hypothetical protein
LYKLQIIIFLEWSVIMKISGMTGEKVTETGVYRNAYGKKVSLEAGTEFPPCPQQGKNIKWEIVES